jgi:ribosomal protein L37E
MNRTTETNYNQSKEPSVRVNLSQADNVACNKCGNHTFIPVMLMKRLSPIISPTGKEAIVPIQTFACNACGFVNAEFLPTKQEDQNRTDTPTETTPTSPESSPESSPSRIISSHI